MGPVVTSAASAPWRLTNWSWSRPSGSARSAWMTKGMEGDLPGPAACPMTPVRLSAPGFMAWAALSAARRDGQELVVPGALPDDLVVGHLEDDEGAGVAEQAALGGEALDRRLHGPGGAGLHLGAVDGLPGGV